MEDVAHPLRTVTLVGKPLCFSFVHADWTRLRRKESNRMPICHPDKAR